jgi:hypothetical protein
MLRAYNHSVAPEMLARDNGIEGKAESLSDLLFNKGRDLTAESGGDESPSSSVPENDWKGKQGGHFGVSREQDSGTAACQAFDLLFSQGVCTFRSAHTLADTLSKGQHLFPRPASPPGHTHSTPE